MFKIWRMFRRLKFWAVPVLLVSLASPMVAQVPASGDQKIPAVSVPDDGSAVVRVVAAERFTLETAYASGWAAERPEVKSGLIVVLEVKKEFVRPRQTRQAVLYAGGRPVEMLNSGYGSGKVVGIIADRADGTAADLSKLELFFGTPMLPERVSKTRGGEEREAAQKKGIRPLPTERRGPEAPASASHADRNALLARAGAWIIEHAPDEKTIGEMFREGAKRP